MGRSGYRLLPLGLVLAPPGTLHPSPQHAEIAPAVAEHADGAANDAFLWVLALAGIGVGVSRDFDTIHRRSHRALLKVAQELRGGPSGEIP